jgi:hypothetical protein
LAPTLLFAAGDEQDPESHLCDTVSHSEEGHLTSSTKDARAVRSGAALRDGLLRLLEKKAFDQITVRDICAEAGVHYATFFHIAAEQISTLVDLTLPFHEPMEEGRGFHMLCAYVEDHRNLWSTLLNGGAGAAMREEWLRRARQVSEGREPIGSWLPQELGTNCSVALIIETVSWWLLPKQEAYSAAEVATILHRLVASSTLTPD